MNNALFICLVEGTPFENLHHSVQVHQITEEMLFHC